MKISKVLLIILSALLMISVFAACSSPIDEGTEVYTIVFNKNGGEGNNVTIFTNGRQQVILPADPIREGYEFLGWYYDVGIWNKPFTSLTLMQEPIFEDKVVYARWTTAYVPTNPNEPGEPVTPDPAYAITFISEDRAEPKSAVLSEISASYKNLFTRPGYTFVGWYTNKDFEGEPITLPYVPTAEMTLYAKWEVIKYTITFDGGEGVTGTAPVVENQPIGATFTLPQNTFSKQAHVFLGWSDGQTVFDAGDTYTLVSNMDITFTAQWARTYHTEFKGGEGALGTAPLLPPIIGGEPFTLPQSTFSRIGYIFGGWSDGDEIYQPGNLYIMPHSAISFDAVWIKVYNIIFEGGEDVSGEPPIVDPQQEGADFRLPAGGTLTKENYDFKGWTDDTGTFYLPDSTYRMKNYTVTFTAVWEANTIYDIIFIGGPGTSGAAPSIPPKKAGAAVILPSNTFSKSHYSFRGWSYDDTLYQPDASFTMPDHEVTFTAAWTPINYSIRYHIMEGYATTNPILYNIETETFTLTDPVISGYTFGGWYEDEAFNFPSNTTILKGSVGDRAFYAKMIPNTYKIYFDDTLGGATVSNVSGADANGKYLLVTYKAGYETAFNGVKAERMGYTLAFWSYNGADYSAKEVWGLTHDITLTAVWTLKGTEGLQYVANSDGISYSVNGYTGQQSSVIVPSYYEKKPVTGINRYAFYDSFITEINLPDSLVSIGEYAFNKSLLAGITLPAGLISIGAYAFSETPALEYVKLKEGALLASIAEYAFSNAPALRYIRLPDTLVSVGGNVFAGSLSLKIFSSATGKTSGWSQVWNSDGLPVSWGMMRSDDYYYSVSESGIQLCEYIGAAPDVIVPAQINGTAVTRIGRYAFRENGSLKGVILPASVVEIEAGAFKNCASIEYIHIRAGIAGLPAETFEGCNRLIIYTEGGFTYSGNIPLHKYTGSIYFYDDWHYIYRQDGTLMITRYVGGEAEITLPSTINDKAVTAVGAGAFRNNIYVTSVTVPASVTYMETNVFENCGATIFCQTQKPVGYAINWNSGNTVYWNYEVITSDPAYDYVIYDNKIYITAYKGGDAYVTVPGIISGRDVTGIYGAFNSLPALKSVFIPLSVTEMSNTFSGTPGAVIYAVADSAPEGWFNWNKDNLPVYYQIGALTQIDGYIVITTGPGEATVAGYTGELKELVLPETVNVYGDIYTLTAVGARAFYGIDLIKAYIPSNYTGIGENAFGGNNKLVIYHENAESLTSSYGNQWHGGAPVYYGAFEPQYDGSLEYVFDGGEAVITGYIGSEPLITIPSSIGGVRVKGIGGRAFINAAGLTSVSIPVTVTSVGRNAFGGSVAISAEAVNNPGWEFGWNILWGGANNITSGDYAYAVASGEAYITAYRGTAATVQVPSTIDGIMVKGIIGAFRGNHSINTVIVPLSVSVLAGAFSDMSPSLSVFVGAPSELAGFTNWKDNAAAVYYGAHGYYENADGIRYMLTADNAYVTGYAGSGANLVIPRELEGRTVSVITDGAFEGAQLMTVTVYETVTLIGRNAFKDCDGLVVYLFREIYLGETHWYDDIVTVSGLGTDDAVNDIDGIQFYVKNNKIIVTRYTGAANEINFDAVTAAFPFEVYRINDKAFYGSTVKVIFIPATVKEIGDKVFENCSDLTIYCDAPAAGELWPSDWHGGFDVVYGNGIIQNIDYRYHIYQGKAYLIEYIGGASAVTVPSYIDDIYPVVSLGEAFKNNTALTSLVLPEAITEIDRAIAGCYNLTSINIPNAMTEIKDNTFKGFSKLIDVTFGVGSAVARIGAQAFYGCKSLASIELPSGVTSIGERAFYDCDSLTQITLPAGITEIPAGLFDDCNKLAAVNVNPVSKIGDNAFRNCRRLGGFDLSAASVIGKAAFKNAESLGEVTFSALLERIEDEAFSGCTSIRNLSLPASVNYIGNAAFKGATALYSIGAGALDVEYIGESAFENCAQLNLSAGFSDNLHYIGARAFYGVGYLGNMLISAYITHIGSEAFAASGIENIEADNLNPSYMTDQGVLYNKSGTLLIQYPVLSAATIFEIPSDVRSIAPSAFRKAANLSAVTIHGGVLTIGEYAFTGCIALSLYMQAASAFLGYDVNFNSSNRPVYWSQASYDGIFDNLIYVVKDGKVSITGYDGAGSYAEIPSEIGGYPVTAIGSYAFSYSGIKWVSIPSSVLTVGADAFVGSSAVVIYCESPSQAAEYDANWNRSYNSSGTKVTLPVYYGAVNNHNGLQYLVDNDTVTITKYIGSAKYVEIPSTIDGKTVTVISHYAFSDTAVRGVLIPSGVITIRSTAFSGTSDTVIYAVSPQALPGWETGYASGKPVYFNIETVSEEGGFQYIKGADNKITITRYVGSSAAISIPAAIDGAAVAAIGKYAFAGIKNITSVTVPASIVIIGEYAFSGCSALSAVNFEASSALAAINAYAFRNCTALTEIEIPSTVLFMGYSVFGGSINMQYVVYAPGSAPSGWSQGWNYLYGYYIYVDIR